MAAQVLLIESNIVQLSGKTRQLLEQQEYKVAIARDAQDATGKVSALRPRLILLDIIENEVKGFEICHQLKSDLKTRHIPVIMLLAEGNLKAMVRAYNSGADYCIIRDDQLDGVLPVLIRVVLARTSPRVLGASA